MTRRTANLRRLPGESLARVLLARVLHCLCALCGHRWTAAALGDCPACGGTRRLVG